MSKTRKTLKALSHEEMGLLMHHKKKKRLLKGEGEFNCFIQSEKTIHAFLKTLSRNLNAFPNPTHFQLAFHVTEEKLEDKTRRFDHWFFTNFYIKDGQIYTFTLETFDSEWIFNFRKQLDRIFPKGKHFEYDVEIPFLNASHGCGVFTREFASILSEINPELMYEALQKKVANPYRQGAFSIDDLKGEGMEVLVPLFRSMQSLKTLMGLSDRLKSQMVSTSRNMTLDQFVRENKKFTKHTKKNKFVEVNYAMQEKEKKYVEELNYLHKIKETNDYYDYTGMGFVSFPILACIHPQLNDLEDDKLRQIILNFIEHLKKTIPKPTGLVSLFSSRPYQTDNLIKLFTDFCNDLGKGNKKLIVSAFIEGVRKLIHTILEKEEKNKIKKLLDPIYFFFIEQQKMLPEKVIVDKKDDKKIDFSPTFGK